MKELKKVLVWDDERLTKVEARLVFNSENGTCFAISEYDYDGYLHGCFKDIDINYWENFEVEE